MKKILTWIVVIGLLAAVLNDVGRYFKGWRIAVDTASQAALSAASLPRRSLDRTAAWGAIVNVCRQNGAVPENVVVDGDGVMAYVRYDVAGTALIAPILQMTKGDWQVKTWWKTTVPVRANAHSMY